MYLKFAEDWEDHMNCPHCKTKICVDDWDSEYGDPVQGEHEGNCPSCGNKINFTVEIMVKIKYAAKG